MDALPGSACDAPGAAGRLIVISAPSGVGKTTLCRNLLQTCPTLDRAITCTTRPPRPGEQPDVDYYFLAPADFQQRAAAGAFLEHATVHGHRYGTLKQEALDRLARGRDVLLNIDVQGAAIVRQRAADDPMLWASLVSVFLAPPSLQALEQRLRGRASDPESVIQRRLAAARDEIARWREFDYLIVSGTPEEDLARMQAILAAESMRVRRLRTDPAAPRPDSPQASPSHP